MGTCTVEGCGRDGSLRRGYCTLHYQRFRAHGCTDEPKRITNLAKLLSNVRTSLLNPTTDWRDKPCLLWIGAISNGYGQVRHGGTRFTHQVAYEEAYGSIPKGMDVCHRCDVRGCYEPSHLFVGTRQVNVDDMLSKGRAYHQKQTHCKHGHEFTLENTYRYPGQTKRSCRICRSNAKRAHNARKQAEAHRG